MSSLPKISIVIQICGGLGNQLFQYLFAKANFTSPQYQLIFDYSDNVVPDIKRPFVLDQLGLPGNFMHCQRQFFEKEGQQRVRFKNIEWLSLALDFKPFNVLTTIDCRESPTGFKPLSLPDADTAYFGYWQSYQHWPNPKKLLTQTYYLMRESPLYKEALSKSESLVIDPSVVAIHIRGGDYRKFLHFHGVCQTQYYQKALAEFDPSQVHVYTDDPAWANFILPNHINQIKVAPILNNDQIEFLTLMRYSRLIIPNSSYAYLAAWFASVSRDSIQVIAPYPWFSFDKPGPEIPKQWHLRNRTTGNTLAEDAQAIRSSTISVIIPVHSRKDYIRAAISSVLQQTYLPIEIIISANAITPEANAEIQSLEKTHPLIRIIYSEKPSLSHARNVGIESAKGEWIAFLDDDDLWETKKLELQLSKAIEMGATVCASNFYEFEKEGISLERSNYLMLRDGAWNQILVAENTFSGGSAVLAHADVFKRVGLFDENLPTCEDHDMWWRMAKSGEPMLFMEESLVWCRKNASNMSGNIRNMIRGQLIRLSKILSTEDVDPKQVQILFKTLRRLLEEELESKPQPNFPKGSFFGKIKSHQHLAVIKRSAMLTNIYLQENFKPLALSKIPIFKKAHKLTFGIYALCQMAIILCFLPVEVFFYLKECLLRKNK